MKQRYRLFQRGGGVFYSFDNHSGKQISLRTRDFAEAKRLLNAKNEAELQPAINRQIARAYLMVSDPEASTRTWRHVMNEMGKLKKGVTRERWERGVTEAPFDRIRHLTLIETRAEHFLTALTTGTVSTNIFLRRLHNFSLDMNWLPVPIIPRRQWPPIQFSDKRAITLAEHQKILGGEHNPEWRAFYDLLWHLGGSQSDIASLRAENINWDAMTISYFRMKTKSPVVVRFGETVSAILKTRPWSGPIFPMLSTWPETDRAKAFCRRCRRVEVKGVSLHSYRYAWAERANTAGMPERWAMQQLGHKSKAVHQAYSKRAAVVVPPLESYEKAMQQAMLKASDALVSK
jgi:integrase